MPIAITIPFLIPIPVPMVCLGLEIPNGEAEDVLEAFGQGMIVDRETPPERASWEEAMYFAAQDEQAREAEAEEEVEVEGMAEEEKVVRRSDRKNMVKL